MSAPVIHVGGQPLVDVLTTHGWTKDDHEVDGDLVETFGPQWRAVVALVRRRAVLTTDEAARLGAAWGTARGIARGAARGIALGTARGAARGAALGTARDAAWDAALAVVTWDLATADGPYTTAHRDLLIAPWREVIGEPTDLVEVES